MKQIILSLILLSLIFSGCSEKIRYIEKRIEIPITKECKSLEAPPKLEFTNPVPVSVRADDQVLTCFGEVDSAILAGNILMLMEQNNDMRIILKGNQ